MHKSNPNSAGTKPGPASVPGRRKGEYGPLPATHPFYDIVERVTSEWRHLEHALDMVICELAAVDQKLGFCITGQLNGHWPRVNAITALAAAKSLDRTLIVEFELLGSRISKLEKKKNLLFACARSWADVPQENVNAESSSGVGGTLNLISLVQAEIVVLWQLQSRLRSETTLT